MRALILASLVLAAAAVMFGCNAKSAAPVSGADLVAPAIAARYVVSVESVTPAAEGYDWVINALNASEYTWKGTLTVKLLTDKKVILEQHDFPIVDMVPPAGANKGLKFHSKLAPTDLGGTVSGFKVETNVIAYEEPKKP